MLFKPLAALASLVALTVAAPQQVSQPPVSTFTATRLLQSFNTAYPFVTTITSVDGDHDLCYRFYLCDPSEVKEAHRELEDLFKHNRHFALLTVVQFILSMHHYVKDSSGHNLTDGPIPFLQRQFYFRIVSNNNIAFGILDGRLI
ncbi:hypothetical protein A0H81_08130 [Grifola frondosa]|uniref:Uncharacterized protein n=1 Tax=Grifola frondosa TaxID=5627 RepID=A0A1C7M4R0_GRIFR|nr:hypothetical protein A0H81_08130 [Grifola frondosa]